LPFKNIILAADKFLQKPLLLELMCSSICIHKQFDGSSEYDFVTKGIINFCVLPDSWFYLVIGAKNGNAKDGLARCASVIFKFSLEHKSSKIAI